MTNAAPNHITDLGLDHPSPTKQATYRNPSLIPTYPPHNSEHPPTPLPSLLPSFILPLPALTSLQMNKHSHTYYNTTPQAKATKHSTIIWQWNCRGYRRKRGTLLQYIGNRNISPDVIALQETNCDPSLQGYVAYTHKNTNNAATPSRAATLVAKHIPSIDHSFPHHTDIPHVFTEILPKQKNHPSLFILNVYSPPQKAKHDDFKGLFHDAVRLSRPRENSLVILGDFNAAHTTWGYAKESAKGRKLAQAISTFHLTIMTEPDHPTRIGNSVCRDTCPDLTLTRTQASCTWSNLEESLGSDHFILETEVCDGGRFARKLRPLRLTNWDQFRSRRGTPQTGSPTPESRDVITSIREWTQQLRDDVDRATKKVQPSSETPAIDPHLLHLWDARRGLTR